MLKRNWFFLNVYIHLCLFFGQFEPSMGPVMGRTNITVSGINLGKDYVDIKGGVKVAGVNCMVHPDHFESSQGFVWFVIPWIFDLLIIEEISLYMCRVKIFKEFFCFLLNIGNLCQSYTCRMTGCQLAKVLQLRNYSFSIIHAYFWLAAECFLERRLAICMHEH